MPRVSVIIPNYNHAPYLRQRIISVLEQTYRDIEVIILDDASTDDSLQVMKEFEADPRVTLMPSTVNSGSTFKQWNKGVRQAKGAYVWFAESDDYADPRLLERLVGMLESNPTCSMACCESWYVHGEEPPVGRTNDSHLPENSRWREDYVVDGRAECVEHLVVHNTMPNASAIVMRRESYERVGGADESMRLCGDWMLWVKLLEIGDLAHVGDPLNYYRCHTAAVRTKNFASPRTQAEVYGIITYIHERMNVPPAKLEQVLGARGKRFLQAAWDQQFSARDVWTVYRAARRVDAQATQRLLMQWLRWRAGAVRRRLLGERRKREAPSG